MCVSRNSVEALLELTSCRFEVLDRLGGNSHVILTDNGVALYGRSWPYQQPHRGGSRVDIWPGMLM